MLAAWSLWQSVTRPMGSRLKDVPVPLLWSTGHEGFIKQTVTAANLPPDLRPALLHTWTDPVQGTCCRVLDLSKATTDISDRLGAILNRTELEQFATDRG